MSGSSQPFRQRQRPSTRPAPISSPGWRQKAAFAFKSPPLRHRPAPRTAPNGGSIGAGDGRAGPGMARQSRPHGPTHRKQLHPKQSRAQASQDGADPSGRQGQYMQRDRRGQHRQSECRGSDEERGERGTQTHSFEVRGHVVDHLSAIRAALRNYSIDGSASYIAVATPLAAVCYKYCPIMLSESRMN
jgi:hypothetical protein